MAEIAAPGAPMTVVRAAAATRRYSMRARDPAVLAGIIGQSLPGRIGETRGGIARLGPDEYYARLPIETHVPRGEGAPVSIVEVTDRAEGFVIEGARAVALLATGCPLDLASFPAGRSVRTIFETVEIIVEREADDRWHVEVARSLAPWFSLMLRTNAPFC